MTILGAAVAIASHGDDFIDLASAPGSTVVHDGAGFIQGGVGAGTGQFDPFTTANPGGSTSPEEAVTVCTNGGGLTGCPSAYFHTHTGGDRTHEIKLSAIPELVNPPGVPAGIYREFTLDANDTGNDDFMSIDDIHILLDEQVNLAGYNPGSQSFATNENSEAALLVYDLDVPVLMRSQTFTPGSGVSDITLLVPTEFFVSDEDCSYGATECEQWVYFYFLAGDFDETTVTGLPSAIQGKDWDVSSGFEEWRTRLVPVVDVDKDVNISFDRDFDWTVTKSVDPTELNMFIGESGDVEWTVTWDKGEAEDSNIVVSGTIDILNPTGSTDFPIVDDIDATINSVSDVLTAGGFDGAVIVNCPVTFPHVLEAGDTLTCTYSQTVSDTEPDGTNTATVNIDVLDGTQDYTDVEDVLFASATVNVTDDTATLSDARPGNTVDGDNVSADGSESWEETFTCGDAAGTHNNTVRITEDDSGEFDEDSAAATVNCYELQVEKDANTSLTRTYDWTLDKQVSIDGGTTWVDDESVDLFVGDSQDYLWRLVATKGAPVDSGWLVEGDITITNPAPIAADDVSVTDVLSISGAATVDCDPIAVGDQTMVDIAANSAEVCSYSLTLADAVDQTNTATATLFGHGVDGTADVDFSTATVTEVDESATFSDPEVPLADGQTILDSGTFESSDNNYACGSDQLISNTATLTEDNTSQVREDTSTLDVDCHELQVEKDANTSLTRTYDWTLDKQVSLDGGTNWVDSASVEINVGESQDYLWRLVATKSAGADSDWLIEGDITITNPAPIAADDVSVSDVLSVSGAATVDCDPVADGNQTTVDIAAGGSETCSYSASPGGAIDQTNTATATLFGHGVDGTANVDFSTATVTEVDESATLSDPEVPLADGQTIIANGTFMSGTLIYTCGETNTIVNTAQLTEDDSGQIRQDSADLTVTCVPTAEGCTPGFWQGGSGLQLWDEATDQLAIDLGTTLGGPPFYAGELVGTFFPGSSYASSTLLEIVGAGGGNDPERKATRDLIAALLNAEDDQIDYPATIGQILDDFENLTNTEFHEKYGAFNELGCDRSDAASMWVIALPLAVLGAELLRRGRHERKNE